MSNAVVALLVLGVLALLLRAAVRSGRLEYRNRTVDVPFDGALRAALLETQDGRDLDPRLANYSVSMRHGRAV